MNRRHFLRLNASLGMGVGLGMPVYGESGSDPEVLYARYVPRDKGLSPEWLASLTRRGHPLDTGIRHSNGEVDLERIGMTVGGLCCGTVYLSGDGRLWVWDIFNQHHEGVVANSKAVAPDGLGNILGSRNPRERDGANFLLPPRASGNLNGVDLYFSLLVGGQAFRLDLSGWEDVVFEGKWPLGTVDFKSSKSPLTVRLQAYSPFIPLNFKDSSLPLTVMEYTVNNPGNSDVTCSLVGHLNNPAGQFSKREPFRHSVAVKTAKRAGVFHSLVRNDQMPAGADFGSELDFGSMELAALHEGAGTDASRGTVSVPITIRAGGSVTVRFVVAWHFPNLHPAIGVANVKRHYARDFTDARAVVDHFAEHQDRLCGDTRKWVATWNDSTLPQWLLDRTILPANTLQTQNCLMFDNGRFWAWEGIGCCHGTCGHVWEYSQGHARLFPEIERNLREITDFKIGMNRDGSICFRGSNAGTVAIDSQCAYILRTLRDWQLSDDPDFLKRVWEPCKMAIGYLVGFDRADPRGGLDGLLDGMQHNTLDAEWFGKVHVLCSMYLAALRAGEELAKAMGDAVTERELRHIHGLGAKNIGQLFNGEYYEQIEDPAHSTAIGVGKGCYIDQVMGQFWANQVGLGRLYDAAHQKSALRALWAYNFVPEYGSFRQGFKEGRHYATQGDSGLLMCTWPKGGLREDFKKHWQYAYFNEFMTGFEYQAAAHMVAERDEDLVQYGLAIARAVHDRYSAKRGRNPYNEIECSDHYARAGSSYGVFLAACGFEYDQSKGRIAFDPVFQKEHFRAPFTTSQAWGTYEQKDGMASLRITHGELHLKQIDIALFRGREPVATINGQPAGGSVIHLRAGDLLVLS